MTTLRSAPYRCSRSSPAGVSTGGAPQAQCERCAGWTECLSGWLLHAGAAGSVQLSTLTSRECATFDMDPSRARRTISTNRPLSRPPFWVPYLRAPLSVEEPVPALHVALPAAAAVGLRLRSGVVPAAWSRWHVSRTTSDAQGSITRAARAMPWQHAFSAGRRSHGSAELWTSEADLTMACLLYTSPSPRDGLLSRMPSSA